MRLFFLNWILVAGFCLWLVGSIILLVGYEKGLKSHEDYEAGTCKVDKIGFENDVSTIFLGVSNFVSGSGGEGNWIIVAKDIPVDQKQNYTNYHYPLNSNTGCLRNPYTNILSVTVDISYAIFIASFILYLISGLSIATYAILQVVVFKKRQGYSNMNGGVDDVSEPSDLTLFQNSSHELPSFEKSKNDFAFAQKILWDHREQLDKELFRELINIQLKAIVTENADYTGQQNKFQKSVYKEINKLY
tara:strand:- start:94220 stop:94957 length:738 start_codon:yes stop_codon:yes gene_type:complete